jgi:membrane-associated protein
MEILLSLWDFIANLDVRLGELVREYGVWVYVILFTIVFCETGLVITPFLPGDSLLFAAGAVWASSGMDAHWLCLTLITAALCGDNVNYWIGRTIGQRLSKWDSRFFNRKALDKTHLFYEKHGPKAIIIARFVPLVRTFVPFVAGIGRMTYSKFLAFSVIGALVWVLSLVYAGYFFGSIPIIKENFTAVIFIIIGISLMPVAIEFIKAKRAAA